MPVPHEKYAVRYAQYDIRIEFSFGLAGHQCYNAIQIELRYLLLVLLKGKYNANRF